MSLDTPMSETTRGTPFVICHQVPARVAFGVVVAMAAKWRVIPVVWAVIVARMYFGEHNLLDVVAGAAMGTAFATVLWFFFLNKFAHPDCRCVEPS
jgi:membrane-associated phospholipid phosphatase